MRARMVWVAFLALALFAANAAAECALPLNQSAAGGLEGQADFTNWYGGGGCTLQQGQALKATYGGRDVLSITLMRVYDKADQWDFAFGIPGMEALWGTMRTWKEDDEAEYFLTFEKRDMDAWNVVPGTESAKIMLDLDVEGNAVDVDGARIIVSARGKAFLENKLANKPEATQLNQKGLKVTVKGVEQGSESFVLGPDGVIELSLKQKPLERAPFKLVLEGVPMTNPKPPRVYFYLNRLQQGLQGQPGAGAPFDPIARKAIPFTSTSMDLKDTGGYYVVNDVSRNCVARGEVVDCTVLVDTVNGKPLNQLTDDAMQVLVFSNFEPGEDSKGVLSANEIAVITLKFGKREAKPLDVSIWQQGVYGEPADVVCSAEVINAKKECELSARNFVVFFESVIENKPVYFNAKKSGTGLFHNDVMDIEVKAGRKIPELTGYKAKVPGQATMPLNLNSGKDLGISSGYYYVTANDCVNRTMGSVSAAVQCPVEVGKFNNIELPSLVAAKDLYLTVFSDVKADGSEGVLDDDGEFKSIHLTFKRDAENAPCLTITECLAMMGRKLQAVLDEGRAPAPERKEK